MMAEVRPGRSIRQAAPYALPRRCFYE